jgi:hypothetical protein
MEGLVQGIDAELEKEEDLRGLHENIVVTVDNCMLKSNATSIF